MIEFSRKHQEEEMVQTLKEEIQQLTTDEADLEVGFIGYIQLSWRICDFKYKEIKIRHILTQYNVC